MGHPKSTRRMSPLLKQVTRAIAHDATRGTSLVPGDLFTAVTELAEIAGVSVLTRGIVATDEFRSAVDAVAVRHLHRSHADRELTAALERVRNADKRNSIEVAHARVLELGELAHYYAGLASGVALVDLRRG